MARYRSIFLEEDWAHQRYFGWRVVADEPGLRILSKRKWLIDRYLVLLTRPAAEYIEDHVGRLIRPMGAVDILIHDFDDVLANPPRIAGHSFYKAAQSERLLNVATFALDLSHTEPALLAAMTSDYRRKIKKAEAAGVVVDTYEQPSKEMLASFLNAFGAFAAERRLKAPDAKAVASMYKDGRAMLLVARKSQTVSNYLHIYRAGAAGSFMYGVNLSKENDGAGQYLHWQAMCQLKKAGLSWYDLGGVATADPSDGIFNFKKNFGGEFVSLGTEWRHFGRAARYSATMVERSKAMLPRVGHRR